MQLSLHRDAKGAKQKEGGRGFLCGLWIRIGVQNGHLVGGDSLDVRLLLAGGAARRGSTGGWRGGGGGGGGAGSAAAAAGVVVVVVGGVRGACAAGGRRGVVLLFGLLAGELGDAEDELQAAQFDVAAVVE